jgi:hypothetical protein
LDEATGQFSISGTSTTNLPAIEVSLRGPNDPPADILGPLILELPFTTGHALLGDGFDSSFSGGAILDGGQIEDMLAGRYFVAVRAGLPGIAGKDVGGSLIVPEPSFAAALTLVLALSVRRRRI